MIDPADFHQELRKHDITFYAGVPDSLLKDFNAYIQKHAPPKHHIVTANEGSAVAAAVGHYLATSKSSLVYMQNSGLGSAINPLVSLADPAIYRTPLLLLIGWRGEPGVKDEPQHVKQGAITLPLLTSLDIPHHIIDASCKTAGKALTPAINHMEKSSGPVAIVVRKDTFIPYSQSAISQQKVVYRLTREEVIKKVIASIDAQDAIVATTGKASRELFELRSSQHQKHDQDFLTVGSMGHASQIALGIALAQPARKVYCLDGDGAALMHMGALATIGQVAPKNLKHIIINNGVHDSVGGQPTAGFSVNFVSLAKACSYKSAHTVSTFNDLQQYLPDFNTTVGPSLLEIRVKPGARANLGRPTLSPIENKRLFVNFLRK
jgi:phosphonopyruvate decarboxylase